jgi:hypothetical protein
MFRLALFGWLLLLAASLPARADSGNPWQWIDLSQTSLRKPAGEAWIQPAKGQGVWLDGALLDSLLAPSGSDDLRRGAGIRISLPTPEGEFEDFELAASSVMAPELAGWMAKRGWPMRSYRGRAVDDPGTTIHLDWGGPAGFHASVRSPEGGYFIDPLWRGDRQHYASYRKQPDLKGEEGFSCGVEGSQEPLAERSGTLRTAADPGEQLRSYRLAVAATGEYTAFHGGTVVDGLAAIVTTVGRVNQILERDLALTLTLVANNQELVYTDAARDPYGDNLLWENQNNLDQVIGSENYDLGHLFSQGENSGLAYLSSSCDPYYKARGMTSHSEPKNDPFNVDYVAHEIGHQLGANHTYNAYHQSDFGKCKTRVASAAYEPGSGSTIMAYAGICDSQDLQGHSDGYYHGHSLDEMLARLAGGGACYGSEVSGNRHAPIVDAGPDYTIPHATPFVLGLASSEDLDGDHLSYTWEQFDRGGSLSLQEPDNGESPILRSWPPSANPIRVIPRLEDLLAGSLAPGERLPTTDRTLTFRVTARDNHRVGGRIGEDLMQVTSTTAAGPFVVTWPNGGEVLDQEGEADIFWAVAGSDAGEVNTTHVEIGLSSDGGHSYPYLLASATNNDGYQRLVLPSGLKSRRARIKVRAVGNIFFDVSDGDFTIDTTQLPIDLVREGSCSEEAVTLVAPGYLSGRHGIASQRGILTQAGASVLVAAGVELGLQAPAITLALGFVAEAGSFLHARASPVTCP